MQAQESPEIDKGNHYAWEQLPGWCLQAAFLASEVKKEGYKKTIMNLYARF